jgi:hypothetical protein
LADDIFIGDVQKSNNREIRSTNWQVGMDLTEFTYLYIVVAPLWHIILIPSQPVFALSP